MTWFEVSEHRMKCQRFSNFDPKDGELAILGSDAESFDELRVHIVHVDVNGLV